MTAVHAAKALLPGGWASDVRVTTANGSIRSVELDCQPEPGDERCETLLPGMPNLHSHAFQRGMAGRAEVRGLTVDSFWTWREVMYRFALTMSPDQVEAVAALAYMEMLESGFTRVGEFHYLHHHRDGLPYDDIAEMATRIAAASVRTGIRLTLLPVFYMRTRRSVARRRCPNNSGSSTTRIHSHCWSRRAVRQLPVSMAQSSVLPPTASGP